MDRYLLIISCSKDKNKIDKAPAIELYNGMFYKVLKKNFDLQNNKNLDILIISGKYGLIGAYDEIEYYHYEKIKMENKKIKELQENIYYKLKEYLENKEYKEIFINLGTEFQILLNGDSMELLNRYNIIWANGMIGERLSLLKKWLQKINNKKLNCNLDLYFND